MYHECHGTFVRFLPGHAVAHNLADNLGHAPSIAIASWVVYQGNAMGGAKAKKKDKRARQGPTMPVTPDEM
jgi:hypothetical protein